MKRKKPKARISQAKGYKELSKHDKEEIKKFEKFLKLVNKVKIDSVRAIDACYKQVYMNEVAK